MLDRRAIALLGGVGAAALLAKEAEAATPFTTFSYPATGASGSQTDPNRWQQAWINVKDWGAVGDGSTDDSAAVKAAIAYAQSLSHAGNIGHRVYFPPGTYQINSPPLRPTGNAQITLCGPGAASSNISAPATLRCNSASDSLIAIYGDDSVAALIGIENLALVNSNSAGLTIRWDACATPAHITGCAIQGFIGLHAGGADPGWIANTAVTKGQIVLNLAGNAFRCIVAGTTQTPGPPSWNTTTVGVSTTTDNTVTWLYISSTGGYNAFGLEVRDCYFSAIVANPNTGSTGAFCGESSWFNNQMFNWDNCLVVSNTGFCFYGGRFEENGTVFNLGQDDLFTNDNSIRGFAVVGTQFESNNIDFILSNCDSGFIAGQFLTGPAPPPIYNGGTTLAGMKCFVLTNVHISGVNINMTCTDAAIDLSTLNSASLNVTFSSIKANNWKMPPAGVAAQVQLINCDNPTNAFPFADLPASPIEGMEFDVTNQLGSGGGNTSTPTFGQTGAAGSGGTAFHARLRYNGTTWTVMGV